MRFDISNNLHYGALLLSYFCISILSAVKKRNSWIIKNKVKGVDCLRSSVKVSGGLLSSTFCNLSSFLSHSYEEFLTWVATLWTSSEKVYCFRISQKSGHNTLPRVQRICVGVISFAQNIFPFFSSYKKTIFSEIFFNMVWCFNLLKYYIKMFPTLRKFDCFVLNSCVLFQTKQ